MEMPEFRNTSQTSETTHICPASAPTLNYADDPPVKMQLSKLVRKEEK